MNRLSRRRFLWTSATVVGATIVPGTGLTRRAGAAGPDLVPRKLPFPPNDDFGSYEPTITPDGNTIYFARFAGSGDKRVLGTTTDIFVTHRVRQSGEWPGTGADWTPPERLPDTVNSDAPDQEPWISADGKTLHFMSRRSTGRGSADIWVTHKQPDGQWAPAQNLGPSINTEGADHCFMPFDLPGQGEARVFVSIRPRVPGTPPTPDLYTTKLVNGAWQPAQRYESRLLDSIGLKCRFNVVSLGRPRPRCRLRPRLRKVPHDAVRPLRSGDQGMEGPDRRGAVQPVERGRRVPDVHGRRRQDDLVGRLPPGTRSRLDGRAAPGRPTTCSG